MVAVGLKRETLMEFIQKGSHLALIAHNISNKFVWIEDKSHGLLENEASV